MAINQCRHDYEYSGELWREGITYEIYKCTLCDDLEEVKVPDWLT